MGQNPHLPRSLHGSRLPMGPGPPVPPPPLSKRPPCAPPPQRRLCLATGGGEGGGRTPCVTFRRVVVPARGPGQSPVLPFACCVGSLLSVSRCGRSSCWCRPPPRTTSLEPRPGGRSRNTPCGGGADQHTHTHTHTHTEGSGGCTAPARGHGMGGRHGTGRGGGRCRDARKQHPPDTAGRNAGVAARGPPDPGRTHGQREGAAQGPTQCRRKHHPTPILSPPPPGDADVERQPLRCKAQGCRATKPEQKALQ